MTFWQQFIQLLVIATLTIHIGHARRQSSTLSINVESGNVISCQDECTASLQCLTTMKILDQSDPSMATSIGRFIKVNQAGYLLVLCYTKKDIYRETRDWTVVAFKSELIDNSTNQEECRAAARNGSSEICVRVSRMSSSNVMPQSSPDPILTFNENKEGKGANITCSTSYPIESSQQLRMYITFQSRRKTERIELDAENVEASFVNDYGYVNLSYTREINNYKLNRTITLDCAAIDVYSSEYRVVQFMSGNDTRVMERKGKWKHGREGGRKRSHHGKADKKSRCEPINEPLCKILKYNETSLPNMFRHKKQFEIASEIDSWKPLVHKNCSKDLQQFLCTVYFPVCRVTFRKPLLPCRSLCESIMNSCRPLLQAFNLSWPKKLRCKHFPKEGGRHRKCFESFDRFNEFLTRFQ